jgi:uncharacterized protein (DUF1800 family)
MVRSKIVAATLVLLLCLPTLLWAGTFEVATREELNALMVRLRATQFLQHATFGPTDAEITALADRMLQIGVIPAADEWIERQFALPATRHESLAEAMVAADGFTPIRTDINVSRYRYQAWWHNAVAAPDQLRQRMAWALMQILVVGQSGNNFNDPDAGPTGKARWLGLSNYYDLLLDNSFNTYRDVLGGVTFHPIMGVWLSHLRNRKATTTTFPDENYGREVLQLFSMGLYQLNPDGTHVTDSNGQSVPTYDNTHVETFARLFTGLNYAGSTTISNGAINYHQPMIMYEAFHDTNPKQVFGGVTLPGGTPGVADINAGLDNIYVQPSVGPFICHKLIQRFVRSNPSKGYIRRVVSRFDNNGSGQRGDLKAVLKAILLDQEAWDGIRMVRRTDPWRLEVSGEGTERSRLQEPVIAYAHFLRRYGSTDYVNGWFALPSMASNWTQYPYGSPTVFNFYSPTYQPAGDLASTNGSQNIPGGSLHAPEFQLLDAVVSNRTPNRYRSDIFTGQTVHTLFSNATLGTFRCTIRYDLSKEIALAPNPSALAAYLDQTLCCGTMRNSERQALVSALSVAPQTSSSTPTTRAQAALLCVLTSPAYMIVE